jgi:hypothetical protein
MAKLQVGQAGEPLVNSPGVAAQGAEDRVESRELCQQNTAGKLAHAVLAADHSLERGLPQDLLVRRAEQTQVVIARRPLEREWIAGDQAFPFAGADRLGELETVDANFTD